MGGLLKKFSNTYKHTNGDINRFILLLRKEVYPYEYMNSWERFDKIVLPEEAFHSKLSIGDITGNDYIHAKKYLKLLS